MIPRRPQDKCRHDGQCYCHKCSRKVSVPKRLSALSFGDGVRFSSDWLEKKAKENPGQWGGLLHAAAAELSAIARGAS